MKKNKMMRTASVLLVAALMTTSMISGTFAKYTTSADGSDTARVAKFGVNITANGSTFANSYDTEKTATVVGTSSAKVVAPGTKGEMTKMTITGTPEVSVKVSYKGAFDIKDWNVDTNTFYCPLNITIKANATSDSSLTSTVTKGTDYSSETDFENAVNTAIDKYSKEYEPGTDFSNKGEDSLSVSWEWPFDDNTSNAKQTDINDTKLGDAATASTVTLKVTTTVTQID